MQTCIPLAIALHVLNIADRKYSHKTDFVMWHDPSLHDWILVRNRMQAVTYVFLH